MIKKNRDLMEVGDTAVFQVMFLIPVIRELIEKGKIKGATVTNVKGEYAYAIQEKALVRILGVVIMDQLIKNQQKKGDYEPKEKDGRAD